MCYRTIITIKSNHFVYTFIALLAAKCCCGRQVNQRQGAANAVPPLCTIGDVALEKMCKGIWRARYGLWALV